MGTQGEDGPRTLVRAETERGEIALRERTVGDTVVHELVVAGVFAMDTRDTCTETALAEETLALVEHPARVLVGGLGLGFTALTVLKDRRVGQVDVVEVEEDLVLWSRLGLTPTLGVLGRHPRARVHVADIADVLAGSGGDDLPRGPWDLVLLDVDNGPSFLVHQGNARLYAEDALAAALAQVAPGGALAIWAAQREPGLLATLTGLASATEIPFVVEREGRQLEYAIYHARP